MIVSFVGDLYKLGHNDLFCEIEVWAGDLWTCSFTDMDISLPDEILRHCGGLLLSGEE